MNDTNLSSSRRAELEAERQMLYASVIKDFPVEDKEVMLQVMMVAAMYRVSGERHTKILTEPEPISYSYSMKVSGKPEQHTLVRGIAKPGQSYTNRVYMIDGRSVDFTISF